MARLNDSITFGNHSITGDVDVAGQLIVAGSQVITSSTVATTADALETARTITLGGDLSGSVSFDGSQDVTITATVADDSHNHIIANVDGLQAALSNKLSLTGKAADAELLDGQEGAFYQNASNLNAGTISDARLPGTITSDVTGNAATASQWLTSRTITLGGDLSGSAGIDGSSNVTLSATVADDSHDHIIANVDGLQTALDGKVGVNAVAADSDLLDGREGVFYQNATNLISGTVNDARLPNTITSDITGNAATATALATARTISLSGDVSGAVSFDGTANAAITVTVADDSHNHIIANVDGLQDALDTKLSNSGTAANATLLDNLDSTQFLRSDAEAIFDSALDTQRLYITSEGATDESLSFSVNGSTAFIRREELGTSANLQFDLTGSLGTGNIVFVHDGTDTRIIIDNNRVLTEADEGAGNGLDSDTLDSEEGTYYLDFNNFTNLPDPTITLGGDATGDITLTDLNSGTLDVTVVSGNATTLNSQPGAFYQNATNLISGTISDSRLPGTISSDITGNANTATSALAWTTARTISLSGAVTGSVSVDGSQNVTIAATATSDPTLTLAGDATGTATFTNLGNATLTVAVDGGNADTLGGQAGTFYQDASNLTTGTIDDLLLPTTISSDITGNAATATALKTARTFTLSGDITGSVSFDGTSNVTISTVIADDSHSHIIANIDGLQAALDAKLDASAQSSDADTLDGEQGTYYLDFVNFTNVPDPTITVTGDATGVVTLTDLASGGLVLTVDGGNADTVDNLNATDFDLDTVTGHGATTTNNISVGDVTAGALDVGNILTSGYLRGPATFVIDPSLYDDPSGTVIIKGNLQVDGTTTTVDSASILTSDLTITVATNAANAGAADGAGLIADLGTDGQAEMLYVESSNRWTFNTDLEAANFVGDLTGNAVSADALSTARTIALGGDVTGSASFDGSSNITITATVADDSHNHTIANVDGLQTALNSKLGTAGTAANSQLLDSLDSTQFIRSDVSDIVTGVLSFQNNVFIDGAQTVFFDDGASHIVFRDSGTAEWEIESNVSGDLNFVNSDATGDLTLDGNRILTTNDLTNLDDAETLDGNNSAFYRNASNLNAGTISDALLPGTITSNVTGNAGSADALSTARDVSLGGDVTGSATFDGSANITITATVADDSHNHIIANVDGLQAALDDKLATTGIAADSELLDGQDGLYYRNATNLISGTISDLRLPGTISSDITGNAASANVLSTARSITLSGDVTGGALFDGSANLTITATVADDSHNHIISNIDGLQSALDAKLGDNDVAADAELLDGREGAYYQNASNLNAGTISDARLPNSITSDVTGNAATATALATTRSISLSGDASGTANFDGTSNAVISVSIADDSHNHIISNVDGLQAALDAKLDASAQSSDADTLDGINSTQFVRTDVNNEITAKHSVTGIGELMAFGDSQNNTTDAWIRIGNGDDVSDFSWLINYQGSTDTTDGNELQFVSLNEGTGLQLDHLGNIEPVGGAVFGGAGNNLTGVNAATLNGNTSSFFQNADNLTSGVIADARLPNTISSDITGNAASADTLSTARSIALSGDVTGSALFDGGSSITISATVADDSHSHIIANVDGLQSALDNKLDTGATAADSDLLDGQDSLFYRDASNLNAGTVADARLPASISSDITGNAATATELETARTIALGGDVSGSASFDGTANVTITATVADDSHNHVISNVDGLQTALNGKLDISAKAADADLLDGNDSLFYTNASNLASGTISDLLLPGTISSDITGNATTADELSTARTIELTGDVTGTVSFDGSSNVAIATTVVNGGGAATQDPTLTLAGDASGSATFTDLSDATLTVTVDGGNADTLDNLNSTQFTLDRVTDNGSSTTNAISTGTITTSGELRGPANFVIDPAAIGNNTGTVVIKGDLQVDGTSTIINSTSLAIDDLNILIANGAADAASANGAGITVDLGTSGTTNIAYDSSVNRWTFDRNVEANTFIGNLTGSVTGNASSASTLQTARSISLGGDLSGSTSFDGSSNVTINAVVQDDSHNHIISNIDGLQSELNGKLSSTGTAVDSALLDGQDGSFYRDASNLNTGTISDARLPGTITSNITGNAASANQWSTARTISLSGAVNGSTSIDGSGNVSIATTATSDPTLTLSGDASGSATFTNLGNATLLVNVSQAANAGTLDGINSTQFLRSDQSDTMTGDLTIAKNNPWIELDSPGSGATGDEQGAGISIGESGYKGTTALHLTYTGDGVGHIGMGAVTDSVPQFEVMRMQYQSNNVEFLGTITGNGSGLTNLPFGSLTGLPDPTLTLTGDVSGSATFTNLGNTSLSVSVNNANNLDGLNSTEFLRSNASDTFTGGQLNINAPLEVDDSGLVVGRGSGSVGLTINDSQGNANLTFNHADGTADAAGNVARITVNVDSTSGAYMGFEVANNSSTGSVSPARIMDVTPGGLEVFTGNITGNGSGLTNVPYSSLTGLPDPTLTLTGDVSGSATFTNLGNATLSVTVADDSHNHTIANVDGLQSALNGKLDNGATAANSQLLDSINSTQFLRSDTADTCAGQITFTSSEGIEVQAGIVGGYADSTGTGSDWGGPIYSIGDGYNGSGTGSGFVVSGSQYGTTWIRTSHPSALSSIVGEGEYHYRAGNRSAAIGHLGHWFANEVRATGDVIAFYSDERLKDFHGKIDNPVDKIKSLNGYYYTENELAKSLGYTNDKMQLGVSAQEVQKIFPEAVEIAPISYKEGVEEEYLTVKYEKLVPGLIEAVKEQQQQIDTLQETVNMLMKELKNQNRK